MINWPAIIRHGDDPELDYFHHAQDWQHYTATQIHLDESDILIDSMGYRFTCVGSGQDIEIREQQGQISLDEFLGLVKAHAASRGSCCVAKLYAPSIPAAMAIVASLEEE